MVHRTGSHRTVFHRPFIRSIGKRPISTAALIGALALWPSMAQAESTVAIGSGSVEARQMFALLFLMLGPIKVLVPFMNMTQGAPPEFRRQLATRAILYSAAALGLAGLIGQNTLENFAVPVPVLALTEAEARRLGQGQAVPVLAVALRSPLTSLSQGAIVCAMTEGKPVALARISGGELRPVRVLNL